jgi:sugar/nucleoside kinase (ribokinase family)
MVMALRLRAAGSGERRHCTAGRRRFPRLPPPAALQIGILDDVPRLPRRRSSATGPRVVVLGDLLVDVVVSPERPLETGTDVPGRISLRQGGSAANTARWLARLGANTTLITAVGRDAAGRALVAAVQSDGVLIRVTRVTGARTGRIGVIVGAGERSFVADRAAADQLRAADLEPAWFEGTTVLHLPAYSLVAALGPAARRAVELARAAGAIVSVDLASVGPLLEGGRRAAVAMVAETAPDLLLATFSEAEALLGRHAPDGLLELAPVAVVKRGPRGATVLAREGAESVRFEVATERLLAADTTGAGDAFDAGFIVDWLASRAVGQSIAAGLRRAAVAGHRAAARHLVADRPELPIV